MHLLYVVASYLLFALLFPVLALHKKTRHGLLQRLGFYGPGALPGGDGPRVWMHGASVLRSPGHVAVVESYMPQSRAGGNMRVVEATGAGGAVPKLLDSMYTVEKIEPKSVTAPMILVVRRHGASGHRVVVIRP